MEEHKMDKMFKNPSSLNHKYKCQKEKVQNKILVGDSNPQPCRQHHYWHCNTSSILKPYSFGVLMKLRCLTNACDLWCSSCSHHQFCTAEMGRPNPDQFLIPLTKHTLLGIGTFLSDIFLFTPKLREL